jgi:hypothetical protein
MPPAAAYLEVGGPCVSIWLLPLPLPLLLLLLLLLPLPLCMRLFQLKPSKVLLLTSRRPLLKLCSLLLLLLGLLCLLPLWL